MNKKDPPKPKAIGVAYMLKGDKGASNIEPYAKKPTADNQWVVTGPHIMLLPTDISQLDAYPTRLDQGGPRVMWKGTPDTWPGQIAAQQSARGMLMPRAWGGVA